MFGLQNLSIDDSLLVKPRIIEIVSYYNLSPLKIFTRTFSISRKVYIVRGKSRSNVLSQSVKKNLRRKKARIYHMYQNHWTKKKKKGHYILTKTVTTSTKPSLLKKIRIIDRPY